MRCGSSLYFSLISLICGASAWSARIERICLQRQRQDQQAGDERQDDDRQAPAEAQVVVDELEHRVRGVDQRLEDVGDDETITRRHREVAAGRRSGSRKSVRASTRVVAAVAEGVAAREPPGGDDRAAHRAELADRLDRVCRARRLVLAAARAAPARSPAGRGGRARGGPRSACVRPGRASVSRFTLLDQAALASQGPRARARTPCAPSRSTRPGRSGRATSTKSWVGGQLARRAPRTPREGRA